MHITHQLPLSEVQVGMSLLKKIPIRCKSEKVPSFHVFATYTNRPFSVPRSRTAFFPKYELQLCTQVLQVEGLAST